MKVVDVRVYTVREAQEGSAQSLIADLPSGQGEGWTYQPNIVSPMSRYPKYKADRSSWIMRAVKNPLVVEIETDTGEVGFAANYGGGRVACELIDSHLKDFVVGQDPFSIGRIWDQMYRSNLLYGRGGIAGMAMAAIDLALWDLIGKITGQPVYNLLGGRFEDSASCYVTIHPDKLEAVADKGFAGVKLVLTSGPEDGPEAMDRILELVSHARSLLGPNTDIMLECFMGWGADFTRRVARRLEAFDIKWIEDPLLSGLASSQYAELRREIHPIQLAIGNCEFDIARFGVLINEGACDVIQPEVQWIGGLTPARDLAGAARLKGVDISPHCSSVYSYHFAVAQSNCRTVEFLLRGTGEEVLPLFSVLRNEPVPVNGRLTLGPAPGFGVELDRDRLIPYATAFN